MLLLLLLLLLRYGSALIPALHLYCITSIHALSSFKHKIGFF